MNVSRFPLERKILNMNYSTVGILVFQKMSQDAYSDSGLYVS